ncbi:uncharacterized protein [Drosophila suzukii]|uniref:Uncharacterized protein n=1 Tax=Drosophila suzukii TaxID=28584 RepID=A0ABM4TK93_DROSZ
MPCWHWRLPSGHAGVIADADHHLPALPPSLPWPGPTFLRRRAEYIKCLVFAAQCFYCAAQQRHHLAWQSMPTIRSSPWMPSPSRRRPISAPMPPPATSAATQMPPPPPPAPGQWWSPTPQAHVAPPPPGQWWYPAQTYVAPQPQWYPYPAQGFGAPPPLWYPAQGWHPAQGYVAPPQHQALQPQAQALQPQAQALQPQAQALIPQPQALQTPPHPHPQEEVLEKAVLVEPEEEPEAQAAIPPLASLILSPRPSAGRRRPVAPRERPGRPYPALGTPRLSLPPNAIEVSQWPQLPTKELQSHFDGNGRQWTTVPYQCWMCWQKCLHSYKARRHNCLASSLTY